MGKSIFVSHVFEDSEFIGNLKVWAKDPEFGFDPIIALEQDMRIEGYDAIKKIILNKIKNCSAVIVLIGNDTHSKEWIKAEVEWAISNARRIVCVRIPNSTGGKPDILHNYEVIDFKKKKVQKALQK
jgi:MTH538 TIR-like domain (DUF1863)